MTSAKKRMALASAAFAAFCPSMAASAQTMTPAPFTQEQADDGHKSYAMNCASCHKADLSGGTGPALVGETFDVDWGRHTAAELYTYVQAMMPYCDGGTLGNREYTDIVAYILSANGAKAGDQELTATTQVKIGDIIAKGPTK